MSPKELGSPTGSFLIRRRNLAYLLLSLEHRNDGGMFPRKSACELIVFISVSWLNIITNVSSYRLCPRNFQEFAHGCKLIALLAKPRNDSGDSLAGVPASTVGVKKHDRSGTYVADNILQHFFRGFPHPRIGRRDVPLNRAEPQAFHCVKRFRVAGAKWKPKQQHVRWRLLGGKSAAGRVEALPMDQVIAVFAVGELR